MLIMVSLRIDECKINTSFLYSNGQKMPLERGLERSNGIGMFSLEKAAQRKPITGRRMLRSSTAAFTIRRCFVPEPCQLLKAKVAYSEHLLRLS